MNAKRSPLILSTVAAPAATPAPRRVVNPQTEQVQHLATAWNTMSGEDRGSWARFSQQVASPNQTGAVSKVGAYASFVAVNTAMLAAGGSLRLVAPAAPTPPAMLGAVTLSATYNTALALFVTPAHPVLSTVLVYGARPMLAYQHVYKNTKFTLLGSISILAAATDISALYLSKFRVSYSGYQIAVKLVTVSPSGQRAAPLLLTAVAASPSGAEASGAETTENAALSLT